MTWPTSACTACWPQALDSASLCAKDSRQSASSPSVSAPAAAGAEALICRGRPMRPASVSLRRSAAGGKLRPSTAGTRAAASWMATGGGAGTSCRLSSTTLAQPSANSPSLARASSPRPLVPPPPPCRILGSCAAADAGRKRPTTLSAAIAATTKLRSAALRDAMREVIMPATELRMEPATENTNSGPLPAALPDSPSGSSRKSVVASTAARMSSSCDAAPAPCVHAASCWRAPSSAATMPSESAAALCGVRQQRITTRTLSLMKDSSSVGPRFSLCPRNSEISRLSPSLPSLRPPRPASSASSSKSTSSFFWRESPAAASPSSTTASSMSSPAALLRKRLILSAVCPMVVDKPARLAMTPCATGSSPRSSVRNTTTWRQMRSPSCTRSMSGCANGSSPMSSMSSRIPAPRRSAACVSSSCGKCPCAKPTHSSMSARLNSSGMPAKLARAMSSPDSERMR
mmetsp:Transcript_25281/g.79351  ORF Transcript_25281/g.79351 Transcript_25281/m.79351 type:complete len:460 (+) Transcript_25281:1462-2841(+)